MPMTVSVTVKPQAKKPSVVETSPGAYRVSVRAPAREGEANRAVIEALADYFSVPKSKIKIIRGQAARTKIISLG